VRVQTDSYRIESAFYRDGNGPAERLKPGARLAPGDALSLQVQTSVPMYFYVVNEDERGNSFLLFPLPGQALQNPLPPGQRHRLPAMQNGELISWQVTSAGPRCSHRFPSSCTRSPRRAAVQTSSRSMVDRAALMHRHPGGG
jgi:hypothetical protein